MTQRMTGVQRYAYEIVASVDEISSEDGDVARRLGFQLVLPPNADVKPAFSQIDVRQTKFGSGHAWDNSVCLGRRHPASSALEISVRCWCEITSYASMMRIRSLNRKVIHAPSAWPIAHCCR